MLEVKLKIQQDVQKVNKQKLFLEALSSAHRGHVLYICQRQITDIPTLPSFDKQYLKMLTFLYLQSSEALLEGLASLPDWQNVPSTIILDGLNDYCSGNKQKACGIVALFLDSGRSCAKVMHKPCELYLSVDTDLQNDNLCSLLDELYCQTMHQTH